MRTVVSSAKSIENENLDVLKKFFIKTVKKPLDRTLWNSVCYKISF